MRKLKFLVIILVIAGILFYWYSSTKRGEPGEPQDIGEEQVEIDPMNILILGLDARTGTRGRTDSIMLLSIRPDREEIFLLSIPRDTRVKIKGGYDKVNAAYAYGGAELARKTIEDFLGGIEIDHHVVLNFDAFVKLIDLVGGVEVDVPVRMDVPDENIDLYPGLQTLDGEKALAYSRFRGTSEGDIGRAKRQQEIVTLLADKLFKVQNIVKLPQIIQTMSEYVEHDFSVKEMMKLASEANQARKKPIVSAVLPGTNKRIDGIWYYLHDEKQLQEMAEFFK
ncbi:MAG: LCP family protein [Bacillota bacterium]